MPESVLLIIGAMCFKLSSIAGWIAPASRVVSDTSDFSVRTRSVRLYTDTLDDPSLHIVVIQPFTRACHFVERNKFGEGLRPRIIILSFCYCDHVRCAAL